MRNGDIRIISRRNWPVGSRPDGRMYEVGVCHNMRARMADNDTATDNVAANELGEIDWLFVDPERTMMPDFEYQRHGTYVEISKFCVALNARQDKWGVRPFTFYPTPVEEVKAA